jgi:hypothetical protein
VAMFYGRMDGGTNKPPALIRLGWVAIGYLLSSARIACVSSLIVAMLVSASNHFSTQVIRRAVRFFLPNLWVSLRAERPYTQPRYSYPFCCKAPLQNNYITGTTICK